MDSAIASKLTSTETKISFKLSNSTYIHKKSDDLHAAKTFVSIDAPASDKFDQNKFVSSILASINPKFDETIKTNINLQSSAILQSSGSKEFQGLHAVNENLTNSIEIVNNNIDAVLKEQEAL